VLRRETKVRARAMQLLYAWELQHRRPLAEVAGALGVEDGRLSEGADARDLAARVASHADALDEQIEEAADKWRLSRIGMVERNILRLGLHELLECAVPPRVVIDEGVRLAQWFAGDKAPAFVNGVLDALARRHGRL
jgi:N utilization substance protein B